MPAGGKRFINASEIGLYVYCRRAWWLKRVGSFAPQNGEKLAEGVEAHARHGTRVRRSRLLLKVALACIILALCLGLPALLFGIF